MTVLDTPTGAAIASAALRYVGAGYAYGGTAAEPGDWDCSSFVSFILGKGFGLTLPGGVTWGSPGAPPGAHGPVVLAYAGWNGATTLGPSDAVAAGDLCIWVGAGPNGHIGIATDAAHMVSALDSTDGTVHTPIAGYGPAGSKLIYRRLNGAGQVPSATPGSSTGAAASMLGPILAGVLVGGGGVVALVAVIIGGAALLGLAGAAVVGAAIAGARRA